MFTFFVFLRLYLLQTEKAMDLSVGSCLRFTLGKSRAKNLNRSDVISFPTALRKGDFLNHCKKVGELYCDNA